MEEKITRPTDYFGMNLARLLADKIHTVHGGFSSKRFLSGVNAEYRNKSLMQRVELIADHLKACLPEHYPEAMRILNKIMGKENPNETGMFKEYYWLMPVGKYIEKYGLDHFPVSMKAIEALTKRNTGEYAIRPYIQKYPDQVLKQMTSWAASPNFHLRRLSSEGLRPKLPWAMKLDLFIDDPQPVFKILELLKKERIKFVKKSVANNLTDYLKVNPEPTFTLLQKWKKMKNEDTQWIIRYATRKLV